MSSWLLALLASSQVPYELLAPVCIRERLYLRFHKKYYFRQNRFHATRYQSLEIYLKGEHPKICIRSLSTDVKQRVLETREVSKVVHTSSDLE